MNQLKTRHGHDYTQPTAVPMLNDGYNLPSKKGIHIVGPIVHQQLTQELERELADCYRNVLNLCPEHRLRCVAFCCISTGMFRFPADRAAQIAVRTVTEWLTDHPGQMDRIIFNVHGDRNRRLYESLLTAPIQNI